LEEAKNVSPSRSIKDPNGAEVLSKGKLSALRQVWRKGIQPAPKQKSRKAEKQATAFVSAYTLAHKHRTHIHKANENYGKQGKKAGKAFCWPPTRATPRKSA